MAANYVLLERIELNASTTSITFNNIPQSGYTDLKFVMSARQSTAAVAADVLVQFNGNAANNSNVYLIGDSASASSSSNGYTPSSNYISIGVGNNATANTFSSVEMYIPNYLSSNSKSFSVDSVSESNQSTSVFQFMLAGLWASSSAINQITVTPASSQSFLQYSTFSLYGLAAVGTTPVIAPKASGGNITTDGTYWIHTFNSTGAFVPATALSCDVLVVAGGGSGGRSIEGGYAGSGGGGAGGFRTATALAVTTTPYVVTVGAGGATVVTGGAPGNDGTSSTFSTITSAGGGGGGFSSTSSANGIGRSGGSGGGGTYSGSGQAGGAGNTPSTSPVQGYAGGSNLGANNGGAGGGGASAAGTNTGSSGPNGYAGGAGATNSYSGSSITYAGGGGGGAYSGSAGAGGSGGGGAGGTGGGGGVPVVAGTAGTVNLGAGGGGGTTVSASGAGGSGIVIVRYLVA